MKNMFKLGGLMAFVMFSTQFAFAQQSVHDGIYMGVDGSYDKHEAVSITVEQSVPNLVAPSTAVYTDDGIAAGIFAGYRQSYDRFTVAAEARYAYSFVKNEPTTGNSYNPTNEFGVSVLPGFWLTNDFLVFGRLGFSQLNTNRLYQGSFFNNTDSGLIYGGGAEIYLNDQISFRADYTRSVHSNRMSVVVAGNTGIITNNIKRQRFRGSLIYKF